MTIIARPLRADDAAAFEAFVTPHTAEAYYLRSNALAAGLVYEGKALQAEYFGAFENGEMVGVIAYSWMNTLLVFAKNEKCLPLLAHAVLPSIFRRGGVLEALLGLAAHVDAVIREMGIPQEAFRAFGNDGLYTLSLNALTLPEKQASLALRSIEERDRELLIDWRMAFNIESHNAQPGPQLRTTIEKEVALWFETKRTFILEKDAVPVSFCGIGGEVPEAIIVGPVFTPKTMRNRKYGRIVTGYGLQQIMKERPLLKKATLFASRPDAIRVYESLGFKRIADWRLALIKEDYRIAAA